MDITKSNWMIIYPGNSLKVIGGEWNNIEPAPNNINFIHWLENNGLREEAAIASIKGFKINKITLRTTIDNINLIKSRANV